MEGCDMKKHDIIEIEAEKLHETERAILISDGKTKAWISKDHIQNNEDGTFSMPEWIALDKGLI